MNCTEHSDSVKEVRKKCGCVDYRCFKCKRGTRIQCAACGGGMKRI